MAILSIPSSIGGVTVPGLATNGPLGILFNNPFAQTNLQYPRDLQTSARGHYVIFTIKDINPVGYETNTEYDITASAVGQGLKTIGELGLGGTTIASNSILNPQTDTTKASISLYIPETMNFTYNQQYNSTSVTSVGLNALSGVAGGVASAVQKVIPQGKTFGDGLSSILGSVASKDTINLGLKSAGLAINPKLQLLFEGLGFREYQMAFTFTPYSQQEAEAVSNIISTFKTYAAPRVIKNTFGGMFFIPPAVFEPQFYFNGKLNNKINQVAQSVLTNIDVNYGPNGWATFNDGAPVQTTLTLQFQETIVLDRDTMTGGNY